MPLCPSQFKLSTFSVTYFCVLAAFWALMLFLLLKLPIDDPAVYQWLLASTYLLSAVICMQLVGSLCENVRICIPFLALFNWLLSFAVLFDALAGLLMLVNSERMPSDEDFAVLGVVSLLFLVLASRVPNCCAICVLAAMNRTSVAKQQGVVKIASMKLQSEGHNRTESNSPLYGTGSSTPLYRTESGIKLDNGEFSEKVTSRLQTTTTRDEGASKEDGASPS